MNVINVYTSFEKITQHQKVKYWKTHTCEQHHIHEYDSFQNKFERNTRSQSEMKNEIKVFTIENRSVIYFITNISTVTVPLVRVAISTKKTHKT